MCGEINDDYTYFESIQSNQTFWFQALQKYKPKKEIIQNLNLKEK